ncbi:MAG: MBL fold metallo-hydrolase [Betaproteobacteria bacterium HGW-Betaproteobacteria-18]|nr:MAG: MBL fold metallo-hydrolase [Betaproteobacteria bacterium HGW-Betaproteobacteria-18]
MQPGFFDVLKWKFASNRYAAAKKKKIRLKVIETRVEEIVSRGDSITYLGHATLWLRLAGCSILTDPVFGDIWPNIKRNTPFPFPAGALPPADIVLISHDHFDHLDRKSIRRLGTLPVYLVPLGYRDWFERVVPGATVLELDWLDTTVQKGIQFRLLPAQHWTRRNLIDSNRRLWGSWMIDTGSRRIFFCGDSGYFRGFGEFGEKYGPFDAAILPIAMNEPRWFMQAMHMDTAEAIQVFRQLGAKVLIPEQWGTFDLTDELLDLPPKVYREEARKAGLTETEAPLIPHGGTWYFPGNE